MCGKKIVLKSKKGVDRHKMLWYNTIYKKIGNLSSSTLLVCADKSQSLDIFSAIYGGI